MTSFIQSLEIGAAATRFPSKSRGSPPQQCFQSSQKSDAFLLSWNARLSGCPCPTSSAALGFFGLRTPDEVCLQCAHDGNKKWPAGDEDYEWRGKGRRRRGDCAMAPTGAQIAALLALGNGHFGAVGQIRFGVGTTNTGQGRGRTGWTNIRTLRSRHNHHRMLASSNRPDPNNC